MSRRIQSTVMLQDPASFGAGRAAAAAAAGVLSCKSQATRRHDSGDVAWNKNQTTPTSTTNIYIYILFCKSIPAQQKSICVWTIAALFSLLSSPRSNKRSSCLTLILLLGILDKLWPIHFFWNSLQRGITSLDDR